MVVRRWSPPGSAQWHLNRPNGFQMFANPMTSVTRGASPAIRAAVRLFADRTKSVTCRGASDPWSRAAPSGRSARLRAGRRRVPGLPNARRPLGAPPPWSRPAPASGLPSERSAGRFRLAESLGLLADDCSLNGFFSGGRSTRLCEEKSSPMLESPLRSGSRSAARRAAAGGARSQAMRWAKHTAARRTVCHPCDDSSGDQSAPGYATML